jgi:hypothetical protein
MIQDICDATLILEPAKNELRMGGDLKCPVCGVSVFPELSDEHINDVFDSRIAAPFDFTECTTDFEFHIEGFQVAKRALGLLLYSTDPRY